MNIYVTTDAFNKIKLAGMVLVNETTGELYLITGNDDISLTILKKDLEL